MIMAPISVVHPFPARMAPDVATAALSELRPGSRLLDPMCGSGTVIRTAVERGVAAVGVDIDPLAVLMARVWTTPLETARLIHDAHVVLERARELEKTCPSIPWHDEETRQFVAYWFDEPQRRQLTPLALALRATR